MPEKSATCSYIGVRGGRCKRQPAPEADYCLLHTIEDEDGEPTNEFINTLLENPHVQRGVSKVNSILDKFSAIVDKAANGEFPSFKKAPPAPVDSPVIAARTLLHFSATEPLTVEIVKARRKHLARIAHPDATANGSNTEMARINQATQVLLASISTPTRK